jgi:hypothetical protein
MADQKLSVERVDPDDWDTVAEILAVAYTNDPIHIWAMPKAATRLADATLFFKFYLRWMRPYSRDVFITSDRTAVVVTSLVRQDSNAYPDGIRHLWTWSSNPLNLPFYRRLGFEIREELRRDDNTPPVTIIWRPVMPLANDAEKL